MAEAAAASTAAPAVIGGWTKHVTCRLVKIRMATELCQCQYQTAANMTRKRLSDRRRRGVRLRRCLCAEVDVCLLL